MTRDEVKKLLNDITTFYPEAAQNVSNPARLADLWTEVLEAEEFAEMHRCLVKFVQTDTRGYAPKIGQLLAMKRGNDDRGLEDWGVWRE